VTCGATFDELQKNIREAVELCFADEESTAPAFVGSPSILANFEQPATLPIQRTAAI
jgi:predicted RNase H-like HicB family nuclease